MNKKIRTILQFIFFLSIGVVLGWLSLKNLKSDDIAQIKTAIHQAKHWLLIPVSLLLIVSHFFRALRWRLLIAPLGHLPSKANTFFAVMIGYLANQAFPRLGEVLKCTVLARYEKIPADKLIGTMVLERIVDGLTLLIIIGITLAIQPGLYSQLIDTFLHSPKSKEGNSIPGWVIIVAVVVILVIILAIWMIRKKKNFSDLFSILKMIWMHVWEGIGASLIMKKRGRFVLYSIIIWLLYFLCGYLGFMALQETEHYGIKEALTVLSAGSIGMVASPGGIGAYAFLVQQTMQLYGLNSVIALAFGWILWLVQTGVVVLGGLISFVALPYYNKRRTLI